MKRDLYKAIETGNKAETVLIELSDKEVSILILSGDDKLVGYSFYKISSELSTDEFYAELEKNLHKIKEETGEISNAKLFLDNQRICFVPSKFFEEANAEAVFSLQHGKLSNARELKHSNLDNQVEAIYDFDKRLQVIIMVFGSCSLSHSYVMQARECFSSIPVSIIFHTNYFNICIKKEGRLQIVRSFNFEKEADVLYHILNSFQLLGLNVEETKVGICGAIDQSSSLYKTLNEFLFDLQFLNVEIELTEDESPSHYFYHLLQFDKCES